MSLKHAVNKWLVTSGEADGEAKEIENPSAGKWRRVWTITKNKPLLSALQKLQTGGTDKTNQNLDWGKLSLNI